MSATTSDKQTRTCSNCQARNPAGANFCANCGAALADSSSTWRPPPGSERPHPQGDGGLRLNLQRLGLKGGGGQPFQLALEPAVAYEQLMSRIRGDDVEIDWEQPPSSAHFVVHRKDSWYSMRLKYAGELSVQEVSPDVSLVRLELLLNWGSAIPQFVVSTLAAVVLAVITVVLYQLVGLIVIALIVYQSWLYAGQYPDEMIAAWKQGLPRAVGKVAPTVAAGPGRTREVSSAERISQLDELRSAGVITQEEYDAKKAEILKEL